MGPMGEHMEALNLTVQNIQTDIKVAYKPATAPETTCPTCGNQSAAPTPMASPTRQSTLRSFNSQSNLRSTSTSSSTYDDALPDTGASSSSEDEADHDSDSDGLPSLGRRPPEERPHTIPSNRPIFEPPTLGLEEILRVQPDTAAVELQLQSIRMKILMLSNGS